MKTKLNLLIMVIFMSLPFSSPLIHTHGGLMSGLGGLGGGLGGHRKGHGAVELLLATGILAKLLNHRAKHGASVVGRQILSSLLGGHRYPAPHQSRFPLDMQSIHPALLDQSNDLLETHASMAALSMPMNEADLLMNQESALLGVRSPMLMGQESALLGARSPMLMSASMMTDTSSLLAAEAHLSQQLMAARRARRLLEARKMLAAQEATKMLAAQQATQLMTAQSEVNNMLAAQEAMQNNGFLTADQSRQIFTALAPPRGMPQRNPGQPLLYANNDIPSSASGNFMGSHTPPQYQGMNNQNLGNLANYQGQNDQNTGNYANYQGQNNQNTGNYANYQGQNNQNTGNYANYQGMSGQSGNGMMGSESVQQSQSVMYSQPSPVYPGPTSSMDHSSSMTHQGSYHTGNAQTQRYGKSSTQGMQNYNNGFAARQGSVHGSSKFQSNAAQKNSASVAPEVLRQFQARSDEEAEEYTVPSDVDLKDAAKIVAGLKGML
ncbi:hypothetical protein JTE90_001372 [Oedothorax gibbosus]|uniref:Uncharacterized protein n=1 Tax=Oedothorax gibbosus TaxID=931172 RepID=A0AAV6VH07_9ARAC|nr:hypothetical protein JTE90_001372 [Oedothorax gibbosus]